MILRSEEGYRKRLWMNVYLIAGLVLLLSVVFLPATAYVNCAAVWQNPTANFTYSVTPSETTPLLVVFLSTSKAAVLNKGGETDPIVSYRWDFGDGTTTAVRAPSHTYARGAGMEHGYSGYEVTLTVTSHCGKTDTKKMVISPSCMPCPVAGFDVIQPAGGGPYTAPVTLKLRGTATHVPASVAYYEYTLRQIGNETIIVKSVKDPEFTILLTGDYQVYQTVRTTCSSFECLRQGSAVKYYNFSVVSPVTVTTTSTVALLEPFPVFSDITARATTATTTVATTTTATTTAAASGTTTSATAVPTTILQNTPQAAPAVPGNGTLSVITNPAGAQVFVDEVPWGASPATIPNLAAGAHYLRLEKAGYQNLSVPVAITDGRTSEYSLALVPVSGTSMVSLPFIGGAVLILVVAGAGAYLYTKRKKVP
jgi:PKD repeat protein